MTHLLFRAFKSPKKPCSPSTGTLCPSNRRICCTLCFSLWSELAFCSHFCQWLYVKGMSQKPWLKDNYFITILCTSNKCSATKISMSFSSVTQPHSRTLLSLSPCDVPNKVNAAPSAQPTPALKISRNGMWLSRKSMRML